MSAFWKHSAFGLFFGLALMTAPLQAEFVQIWSLGVQDGLPVEFGDENWSEEPGVPGTPAGRDNDFYFAGSYPAPVGLVNEPEPWTNLERALSPGNPFTRFHFTLSAEQAQVTARVRFTLHQVWGGWEQGGYGQHQIEVRINGSVVKVQSVFAPGPLVVEANAGTFQLLEGENILQVTRSGGSPGGWMQYDALSLDLHATATVDADGDGLPKWWEEDYGFNDALATDATGNPDADGLTNLQEFAVGTNPRSADTDADGLTDGDEISRGTNPLLADTDSDTLLDGEEVHGVPPMNPLMADSDEDGLPDAWERAANGALVWSGCIGLNFVSELSPGNALAPLAVTGLVPQMNWNSTMPLTSWNSSTGTQAQVATPTPGVLVDSAGQPTAVTLSWDASGIWACGQGGSSTGKLFDGYLNVNRDEGGTLTFSQIPFSRYEVIVYVGAVYDGAKARLRLNDNTADERWFLTSSTAPETRFIEPAGSTEALPWKGNTVRFSRVAGSSFTLHLGRTQWYEAGILGVQIVDSNADADGDGLPTWWELAHGLNPAVADASGDPDGDGLPNSGEWMRKTNPQVADSDADGLSDLVETNSGIWLGPEDTGSNPLLADTDGDGLTDFAEVNGVPHPTNPNEADTDGDGRSDADEIRNGTHPGEADAPAARMPVVTTTPRSFLWVVDNVQIIWDHTRGHVVDMPWGENTLVTFRLANAAVPGREAFTMTLRSRQHRLSHFFYSSHEGGFSHPDVDDWDIWESDWSPDMEDKTAALGFSGHGRVDISDRLRFQIQGSSTGSQTAWNITFSILNQDTGETVVSRSYNDCRLATNVHQNNASWQNMQDPPVANRVDVTAHDAVKVFFQSERLEDTPAYVAYKDSDDDGMPDVWEDLYQLNKNNAADAMADSDSDGLSNLREYLAGTSPRDTDSDNDGASDSQEVSSGSNPLSAASRPPFYSGAPARPATGDYNGNGLPDAWEYWAGGGVLLPDQDADADGVSNFDEAAAGTDPFDAASRFRPEFSRNGDDLSMSWPPLTYKTGRVWQSNNLSVWSAAPGDPEPAPGGGFTQTFEGALSGPVSAFYRLALEDVDTDSDGVSDWAEIHVLGSDPTLPNSVAESQPVDANGDGVPDVDSLSGDMLRYLELFHQPAATGGGSGAGEVKMTRTQAARLLMQGAFGPTVPELQHVQAVGADGWIQEQMALPATLHSTYIRSLYEDMLGQRTRKDFNRGGEPDSPFLFGNNMMTAFARATIQGEDQLRQRVAFALSQILVTSRRDANLEGRCVGVADYYDIFVRNAFGNYYDILMEVTLHPAMGRYLSHVGNQKADPSINRFPDENYAREIMQLFTIGLWELNADGSQKLDAEGHPIPTYGNAEITQLARVMTGFWFGGYLWGNGGWSELDMTVPMTLRPEYHDFGSKALVQGHIIPARAATAENALRDVQDAVRVLFDHPNTPVFIGRQLIQFLVTDNPSPEYVQRVGAVFADNGSGVRGDMQAVIRAILLDDEARLPQKTGRASYGRLKEPVIRAMALARAFGLKEVPDLLWWDWGDFFAASRQEPTFSPSVFNFYRPDYRAPGLLTQNQLSSPVFQITDSFTTISFPNRLWQITVEGFTLWNTYRFPLDMAREKALAPTPAALVEHLNLLFCAGQMSPGTRSIILNAIQQIPAEQAAARAQVAAYLAMICPEGAVMK